MQRLKALVRARGIRTPGTAVCAVATREAWLTQLRDDGVRFRADALYTPLALLPRLRLPAKRALLAAARRDPAWRVLRTVPFLGPIRVAMLVAVVQTPGRFRTKRHRWADAGLAVVTRASAEYELSPGRPVRRRRRLVMTCGLNQNHNRVVKDVFKGAATAAATTAAATRPGALQEWYAALRARGLRAELARVTLARKLAAITLHLWKTGARYDASPLIAVAA